MSGTKKPVHIDIMRSPLVRARGFGPARSGSRYWWAQRMSAAALVPLSFWFIGSVFRLEGATRDQVAAWLSEPLSIILMISFVIGTFYHMQLGLQIVAEDYVKGEGRRMLVLVITKTTSVLLALVCVVSILKLGR